jgi:hypothetical protein
VKIHAMQRILEALPDKSDVGKHGQLIKTTATIVVLLGDSDSPWNVTHLGHETIQAFQKVVETATRIANGHTFATSSWVQFINCTLIKCFSQPHT